MSRIRRIRVVNVGHEDAYYPDLVLEFHGEDTLVCLANGGGKTTLLHHVLQVVRPGAQIDRRRIGDYFGGRRRTVHVAIEFILDERAGGLLRDDPPLLLAGVCFENRGTDRGLDRLTYTCEYPAGLVDRVEGRGLVHAGDPPTLGTLPLTVGEDGSRRVATLRELRQALREGGQVSLYRADQAREYEEKLRSFHIERETWEGMVRINRVEGGLKHYFETVNTVEKLVREHFLPAVLDPDEEANLREAVRQIAESAAELPRLEAEVRLCEAYLDHFGRLRQASAELHEAELRQADLGRRVADRAARIEATAAAAASRVSRAAQALEEAEAAHFEAKARRGAFVRLRALRDLEALREAEARAADALDAARAEEDRCQADLRRVDALDLAVANLRDRARIEALEEKRRLLLQGHEEKEAAWRTAAGLAAGAARRVLAGLEDERAALETRRAEVSRRAEAARARRAELEQERAGQAEALGRNRERLRAGDEELRALEPLLQGRAVPEALAELRTDADRERARADRLEGEAREVRSRADEARARAAEARERAARSETEAAAWQERLDAQAEAVERIGPVLARWGCQPDLPYRERDSALRAVEEAVADRRDRLLEAEALRSRAEREQAFARDEGFPLPTEDLLRVRDALARAGIPTEPGSRWLLHAPPASRDAVVARWPFAPYALVAEGRAAWHAFLERGAEVLRALDLRAPVPVVSQGLLDRTLAEAAAFEPATGRIVELSEGAAFPLPEAAAPFWDPDAFASLRARAEELAAEATADLDRARRAWEAALQDRDTLQEFYRRFPEEEAGAWRTALEDARATAREARADALRAGEEAEACASRADELLEQARAARERAREQDAAAARLEAYWDRHGRHRPALERQIRAAQDALARLEREAGELAAELQALEAEHTALELRAAALDREAADVRAVLAELGGAEPMEPPAEAGLPELLARARAAREALHSQAREVGGIDDQVRTLLGHIDERAARIRRLGVGEPPRDEVTRAASAWDPDGARRPVLARLEQARAAVERARQALEEARAAVAAAERDDAVERGRFQERYGRPPEAFQEPGWQDLPRDEEVGFQRTLQMAVARAARAEARARAGLDEARRFLEGAEHAADRARVVRAACGLEAGAEPGEPLDAGALDAALSDLETAGDELGSVQAKAHQASSRRDKALAAFVEFLRTDAARLAGRLHLVAEDAETALTTHEGVEHYWQAHSKAVEDLRRSALAEKEKLEKEKEDIAARCAGFARHLADEIRSIQRYSTVRFGGGASRRLLQVDLALRDEAAALAEMQAFVQRFVELYSAAPEADRAGLAARSVTGFELLGVVCRLDRARVRIFKPKTPGAPARYSDWEEVRAWSGGEKQVACYLLFVATLTYATYRAAGRDDATKVLLLDNPVGEASSAHLLRIMVELARENAIQLIVLTAHQDPGIWKYFRNLVSLVPVPTSRRTYVQLDRDTMEAFRANFELEEATLLTAPNRDWEEDFPEG
ncbi:hypothetical protein [Deferrisoma camini]|uniref:hypothetical protein n=1 Tax=Deferrisoma camini TaxID=1035120 RepID=UPI00046D4074|nr:hypothetical protein [Deferrisoma camini]